MTKKYGLSFVQNHLKTKYKVAKVPGILEKPEI